MAEGRRICITIDGPGGSGKSTVARNLAKRLCFVHLNSGALFRAVGCEAAKQEIPLDNDEVLARLASSTDFSFEVDSAGITRFVVNGQDLNQLINSNEAGERASVIAVLPKLRQVLAEVQQEVAKRSSVVVEGRDAGTVVFPNADYKFFLDASLEVRAERRLNQLRGSGRADPSGEERLSLESVSDELQVRDHRDSTREIAPNRQADDAILVDSTELSVEEVVDKICALIEL